MSHQSSMTNYLNAFIQGLIDGGVTRVVISPGSRSTPVSILLHQRTEIETFIDVDERSAGFFALGLTKKEQQPVVLVCTSGTAAANYFPAIAEARQSNLPLVVVTTDRPHELRQNGAPQTMNQLHLYGEHVKQFIEMALPEDTQEMRQYAYVQGAKSVGLSTSLPMGPIHVNVPLREPLLPDLSLPVPPIKKVSMMSGEPNLSTAQLNDLAQKWSNKKGIFIVGMGFPIDGVGGLIEVAEKLGWVILADPLANVRSYGKQSRNISPYFDTYLRHISEELTPEVIVRFGKSPVSKPLNQFLSRFSGEYYLVESSTQWLDSSKMMSTLIVSEEVSLLEGLLQSNIKRVDNEWLIQWNALDKKVLSVINEQSNEVLTEANITKTVVETMEEESNLFVSNSMPIRDLDTYLPGTTHSFSIFGNRGVNGIDGIVSSALGVSASDLTKETRLLIGDLACFHDMTGLAMATKYQLPITIILINNDGGGIFSMLSQRELPKEMFDDLFATSTGVDFKYSAKMYGLDYHLVQSIKELKNLLTEKTKLPRLIEVTTNREENAETRRFFQRKVSNVLLGDK